MILIRYYRAALVSCWLLLWHQLNEINWPFSHGDASVNYINYWILKNMASCTAAVHIYMIYSIIASTRTKL